MSTVAIGRLQWTDTGSRDDNMNGTQLRKRIESALKPLGFVKNGKSLRREHDEVTVLFEIQKGFGQQYHFNVGLCIHGMSRLVSDRVELCHIYFRLERLLKHQFETVRTAGSLGEPEQEEALTALIALLPTDFDRAIVALSSEKGLRHAYSLNQLPSGMIRKEVRPYLETGG